MPWLLQIEDVYRWLKSALGRVSRFQPGLRDTVYGFLVPKLALSVGHILRSLHERDRRPQSTYLVPGECEFAEFALVMKVEISYSPPDCPYPGLDPLPKQHWRRSVDQRG